jgi:hypothetical protein
MIDALPARSRLLGAPLRRCRENLGFGLEEAAMILECDLSNALVSGLFCLSVIRTRHAGGKVA